MFLYPARVEVNDDWPSFQPKEMPNQSSMPQSARDQSLYTPLALGTPFHRKLARPRPWSIFVGAVCSWVSSFIQQAEALLER